MEPSEIIQHLPSEFRWLAWVFVTVVGLSVIAQRRLRPLTDATQRASQMRHATLIEALIGLETVKALNVSGRIQARWEESGRALAQQGAQIKLLNTATTMGTAWVSQMTSVATVVIGVYLIADNALSMGALIACTQLTGRAVAPLGQLAAVLVQFDGTRNAYEGVDKMMELPRRSALGIPGFDALAITVFSFANNGTPVTVEHASPAPQPGEPLHYDSFLERLETIYAARFGALWAARRSSGSWPADAVTESRCFFTASMKPS